MITTEKILLEYDSQERNLLPVLKKISTVFGYISEVGAQKVADYFSLPLSKVYEVASFYDLINTTKQSSLVIKVCSGTHCAIGEAYSLIEHMENIFKIKAGDEFNPKIKLEVISCLGRCGEGPIVIVNGKVYEKVTVSGLEGILKEYF